MGKILLFTFLLMSFSQSHANSDFQQALELTRKAYKEFNQGHLKESHDFLIEAFLTASEDPFVQQSAALLAQKIYLTSTKAVFEPDPSESFTFAMIRGKDKNGNNYFQLSYNSRLAKPIKIKSVVIHGPKKFQYTIFPNSSTKNTNVYPTKNNDFTIIIARSTRLPNKPLTGVYRFEIASENNKRWSFPIIFLSNPPNAEFPKLQVAPEKNQLQWTIPQAILKFDNILQGATLSQYKNGNPIPIESLNVENIKKSTNGTMPLSKKSPELHLCALDYYESLSRDAIGVYYEYRHETSCTVPNGP